MKIKKIVGAATSAVMTATLLGGLSEIKPMDNFISEVVVVSAEEASDKQLEADVLYVIVDEYDEEGKYCQWYRTDDTSFRKEGIHVKLNGEDITSEIWITFDQKYTPKNIYDGKNFDYEIPININYGGSIVPTTVEAKIGQNGDANLDHVVDVRDSALIARDVKFRERGKNGVIRDFGRFLVNGTRIADPANTNIGSSKVIANQLALDALKRADGEKIEQEGEGEFSLGLSKANGLPGETVAVSVIVDANDSFESLDALIEWDDKSLKSAAAVAVNGTLCSSYTEEGMVSVIDYGSGAIGDGSVATISFTIPEDAVPGSKYEVYFSSVETFTIVSGDTSQDITGNSTISGALIGVNKPKLTSESTTTSAGSTTTTTTTTTVSTTIPVDTTTSPAATEAVLRGDVNNDGLVNVRDAAFIARMLVDHDRKMEYSMIADYNDDGLVNVRDAAAISKFASQIDEKKVNYI